MNRYIAGAFLMALATQGAVAQSSTNSPYSQFGLGVLSEQSSGFNRGMNGLGLGFHEGNQVNYLNPASYSNIDSLSFIFDAGISGQISNFKEGNNKLNAKNSSFEYVVAGLRAFKHLGISFGLLPYTNIGYSYSITEKVNDVNNTLSTCTYNGTGGLHQVYFGVGWEPFHGLAIGVNGSYLYGNYTKTLLNSYSDAFANSLTKRYTADVRSYKIDFGLQYTANLSKNNQMTLGLTYGMGHKIGGSPKLELISTNAQTQVADTATYESTDGNKLELEIPTTLGAGVMFNHKNTFKIGVDYSLQKWADVSSPTYGTSANDKPTYTMQKGVYKDRHKFTVGTEICPQRNSRNFAKRVYYRAGVSYATPYYYINGQDGPKEYSASIGFGIPIINHYNNRSILNISAQWVQQSSNNFITDNTFRINIGLTFNERWFAKWKVN
ncbi:MAG: hypothetical protein ACOYJK_03560 [Prevotella sp.]|jgi:hypothetical protein